MKNLLSGRQGKIESMFLNNHFSKNTLIIISILFISLASVFPPKAFSSQESEENFSIQSYDEFMTQFKKAQLLQYKVDPEYKNIESLYSRGVELLREYGKGEAGHGAGEIKKLESLIVLLEANLYFLKPDRPGRKVLDIIDDFEERFPESFDLFPNVSIMRIRCFQDLGLNDMVNEEIEGIANVNSDDKRGFTALHDLAEKLFSEALIEDERGGGDIAKKHRADALMIYTKLYSLSKLRPDYRKYRNPILFRMVRIYMSKDQLFNALGLYNNILGADPLSADEIYALGLLYEKTEQWDDALETWRLFSDGVKPGTDHWFEARYRRAVALEALGSVDRACDILTVTLLLHPDMGDDGLTNKYLELNRLLCVGE